jgi:hypothetical protein
MALSQAVHKLREGLFTEMLSISEHAALPFLLC